MKKRTLSSFIGLFLAFSLALPLGLYADDKPQKKNKKKETAYEKLFKGKKYDKVSGKFATLYKADSKVYLELPLKRMGKEMLLCSTISTVSEPSVLTVGMHNSEPLHIRFGLQDSSVVMKSVNTHLVYDRKDSSMVKAVRLNYGDPSLAAFRVMAYTPDSSAVVFDFSSFVASSNQLMPIVPKQMDMYTVTSTQKPELNFVRGMKVFDDNLSVRTEMSFSISATMMGIIPIVSDMPITLEATYTLAQLEEEKMTPRLADARVGINTTRKILLPEKYEGINPIFYTHRWRLVPKNKKAFAKGKLSEPEKPIVFYLDNHFPEEWKAPIREGVLRWNKAFEAIGFKNAIQIMDFPTNDPNFDPDNFRYSCIRYIPNSIEDAKGDYWVDPSTGEIISASIFIYNNVIDLLRNWRFIQTANVDPSVRNGILDKKVLDESLSYVVAHEVGLALGLKKNMAASSAYPTESLRSAAFTQKYGTTPSIMDYARFNYVAQPQDKGVSLTPPELGVYDYYAIKWDYSYFPELENSPIEIAKELDKLVDSKAKDPMYRYAPEQIGTIYDPTVMAEDLGDNAIKSGDYGILNLNSINRNLDRWIKNDEDSRLKDKLYLLIAQQYHGYLKNVLAMVGGIKMNETKVGSGIPRYQVLPAQKQKAAAQWALKQIVNFSGYANRQMEKKGFINVSYFDQLLEYIAKDFFDLRTKVAVANYLDPKSYSQKDFYNDAYDVIFRSIYTGSIPNSSERFLQRYFVALAQHSIEGGQNAPAPNGGMKIGIADLYFKCMNQIGYFPNAAMQYLNEHQFGNPDMPLTPKVNPQAVDRSSMYLYGLLLKLRPDLESRLKKTSSDELKAHYQLLLYKVNKLLDNENKNL